MEGRGAKQLTNSRPIYANAYRHVRAPPVLEMDQKKYSMAVSFFAPFFLFYLYNKTRSVWKKIKEERAQRGYNYYAANEHTRTAFFSFLSLNICLKKKKKIKGFRVWTCSIRLYMGGGGLRAAVRKDEKNVGNIENSLTLIECKR